MMSDCKRSTNAFLKVAVVSLAFSLAGCKSAQQKANEAAIAQAKQTAAQTGTAQQVVTTDKDGTTTTVVQPPAPGQTTQQVTTTRSITTTSTTTASPAAGTAVTTPLVSPAVPAAPAQPVPPDTSVAAQNAPGVNQPVTTLGDVEVARGTTLAIRMNRTISVKTARAGERFSGIVARTVNVDGRDVIPSGTPVEGVIDEAHRRGHFKGRSILELRLTSMRLNGTSYAIDTRENVRTKKGKGKRSSAFIGGGAGLGMLVGGVATGGVGLLVGGLAGAGGGTLLGGLTGNRDLVIPAESVVDFRLADDLVLQPQ